MSSICAVIPAAGRGTRLGLDCPKILAPVGGGTIWSVLESKLAGIVDHIAVVLSPAAMPWRERIEGTEASPERVSVCLQPEPAGMGDAIFRAAGVWRNYDSVLVLWGDQVNISRETLRRAAELQSRSGSRSFVLPLAECALPYVQYMIEHETLRAVRQTREGDRTDPAGLSDAGLFVLATAGLEAEWKAWLARETRGSRTGEINFLPFLPWLSTERGWRVRTLRVGDAVECRGVNTPEDLEFASRRLALCATPPSSSPPPG